MLQNILLFINHTPIFIPPKYTHIFLRYVVIIGPSFFDLMSVNYSIKTENIMNNKIIDHLESWNVKDSVLLVSIASVKNSADYADSIRSFSESLSEKLSLPLFRVSEVSKLDRIFASEINHERLRSVGMDLVEDLNESSKSKLIRLLLGIDYKSMRAFNDSLEKKLKDNVRLENTSELKSKLLRCVMVLGSNQNDDLPRASHVLLLTSRQMMDPMDLTYANSRLKDDFLLTGSLCLKHGIPYKLMYLDDLK